MVNTGAKLKKTQNTHQICFSSSSTEDSDQQLTPAGALVVSNDDLLTEILLPLPVTSILLFKSVCKHWLWILSDRCFTFRYDKLSKSPGLFYSDSNVPEYIPFDGGNLTPLNFCFDPCGIIIVQSCNGLLLCCTSGHDTGKFKYYVFNPTTKQCALIPSIRGGVKARRSIHFMGLAFHQTTCVHYKVVCIRALEKDFQIQMYSSDTGKWKISVESFSMLYSTSLLRKGVYWNGAIYLAPSSPHQYYFQIDDEQWKSLPLKMRPSAFKKMMYFGECRGHLHRIVNHHRKNDKLRLDVYEMSCDHSGWSVKFQVELCELPRAFPEIIRDTYYDFDVIDLIRGEEEDTLVVLRIPGKLIRYNVHDKSFITIIIQDFIRENPWFPSFHRYTETLASF